MLGVILSATAILLLGAGPANTAITPGLPAAGILAPSPNALNALSPFFSDSGIISLSVDAAGTNDPLGTEIMVHKNPGATVRAAFLFAASTGFSGYTPVDGDVTIDGIPVIWDPANTIPNEISSFNVESDVTSLVKPKVDAAPAGDVSFVVAEPDNTFSIEGEILAVILDDPTVTTAGSVTLMYGAQSPAGDMFHVGLADPVDLGDPNFALNLSLGISFGFQPSGQFSTVDVNGTRMTTSAGGQDDGDLLVPQNGALITAGGIGDFNDNPPDPNATDTTCVGFKGPAPLCDDELYNLLPFVNNGDTSLDFTTTNPSNDDNIFFAALDVRSGAAVVGAGIVLGPTSATNNVGEPHTLTATVQDDNGNPVPGVTVTFEVTAGPNAGLTGSDVTDASGQATFTYTSALTGTDHIVARFTDSQGTHTSNEVTKTWVSQGDTTPPSCVLIAIIPGPPKQIQVMVQDTGSGLATIVVTDTTNAATVVPPFAPGTTDPVVVTSTKLDQSQGSRLALQVTDVAGNVTDCDPVVPGTLPRALSSWNVFLDGLNVFLAGLRRGEA